MFTKTGLRPRETGDPFSARKLPPVRSGGTTKTPQKFQNRSGTVTASVRVAQRNDTPKRPPPDSKSRREGLCSSSPAGGRAGRALLNPRTPGAPSGKRKESRGRTRGEGVGSRNLSPDMSRRTPLKPEWDNSLGDPSRFRLTPEEMVQRKLSLISKHNTLVYGQGTGGGEGKHPRTPTPKQVKPAAGKTSDDSGRRLSVGGTSAVQRTTKKDEVVSPYEVSMNSRKKVAAKLAGVSSATTSPLPSRGGQGTRIPRGGGAKGAVRIEASRGSNYVGARSASGNSNDNGDTETGSTVANLVESLDLAGIKKGIEAFTERVCRLEKDSRVIPGEDTEGEAGCEDGPNEGGKMNLMRQVGEHDGGDSDTTDLVERVRLLEAHILRLRFPSTVSPTVAPHNSKNCKTDDCNDTGVAGGAGCSALGTEGAIEDEGNMENEKVASAKLSSADDLRGVIAELLSLLALLLKRAAIAEERLRNLFPDAHGSAEGKSSGETVAVDGSHSEKPRATAWAESIASAGSGEVSSGRKEERAEHFYFLSSHSRDDGAVENDSARKIYPTAAGDAKRDGFPSSSPSRELGLELGSTPGSAEPEKVSSLGSPPKDYWGEALDAVGELVEGDDERGSEASVKAFGMRFSMSSSRVEETQSVMPLAPPTQPIAAADDVGPMTVTPATRSSFRSFESTESLEPRAEPRPLPLSVRISTRLSGAREVLCPIPASTLQSDFGNSTINDRGPSGFGSYSQASSLGNIGGEADGGPVVWAPTPAKEPQYPFERLSPRSPSWLQENSGTLGAGIGDGRRTRVPFTSTTTKGVVGYGADGLADEDYDAQDSAELPAIGQWYTP